MTNAGQAYGFFIKNDGTLWAAGDNTNGVSGVGDGATSHKVPTQVGKDSNWKLLAVHDSSVILLQLSRQMVLFGHGVTVARDNLA